MHAASVIAGLLRWAADRVAAAPRLTPEPHVVEVDSVGMTNAVVNADERAMRNEVACSLLDDDTIGYVVFRVRREPHGGTISLDAQVSEDAWPGVRAAMARCVLSAEEMS